MKLNTLVMYQPDQRGKEIQDFINKIDFLDRIITQILTPKTSNVIFNEIIFKKPDLLIIVKNPNDYYVQTFLSNLRLSINIPCLVFYRSEDPRQIIQGLLKVQNVEVIEIKLGDPFFVKILPIKMSSLYANQIKSFTANKNQIQDLDRKISNLTKFEGSNSPIQISKRIKFEIKKSKYNFDKSLGLYQSNAFKSAPHKSSMSFEKLVIIGSSAGGPHALTDILTYLPAEFPPILVVQHIVEKFVDLFVKRLNSIAALKVKIAEEGEVLKTNTVYVAPGDKHFELVKFNSSAKVKLSDGAKVNSAKPSVDVMFNSAAELFGSRLISVVLTGAGRDGKEGSRAVGKSGGFVIAQNGESSNTYGMNKEVIEAGLAHQIVDISIMASTLIKLVKSNKKIL